MTRTIAPEARLRMAPEERRETILDAAHALFMERGWEAVTIADVLKAAGISKGGFYHHFTAKEDLLTGIVSRITNQILASVDTSSGPSAGNALDRLKAFLTGSVGWKADNISEIRFFAEIIRKPGNDILYRRIFDAAAAAVVPALENILTEGAAEGTFDVADARLTAEMIVGLSHGRRRVLDEALEIASKGDLDGATDLLDTRMTAEGAICDRLLGLPGGTVPLSHPDNYRRMLAGLAGVEAENPAEDTALDHQNQSRED